MNVKDVLYQSSAFYLKEFAARSQTHVQVLMQCVAYFDIH